MAHLDSTKQKLLAKLKRLTSVLQTANMLDLEELVNMAEEQHAGEKDREVNGGDDDNYVDKDPHPTRGEVLRASAILWHYIRESSDMFAWQMETILGQFSRQTHLEQVNSLVETSIADFSLLHCPSDTVTFQFHQKTQPIWVYCHQAGHYGTGMVFSVNTVESSPNNFAAFQAKAIQLNSTAVSASVSPSGTPSNDSDGAAGCCRWQHGLRSYKALFCNIFTMLMNIPRR
ncbi:hypothetical protein DFH08DRAFT_1044378 [Mycena albidolilacea]|uniref:Uncharacterized protein n=1 Tax=Mycena albidolilacea TaxID=1033008 RepID=A0AAD7EDE7_9AGAR|nr:hypothetical protein DFH08DRAFT_1044378 [Mycena albidolilacea]